MAPLSSLVLTLSEPRTNIIQSMSKKRDNKLLRQSIIKVRRTDEIRKTFRIMALLFLMSNATQVWAAHSYVAPSGQHIYYSVISGGVEIVSPYNSSSNPWGNAVKPTGNLVIPDSIVLDNGTKFPVTSIGNNAFWGCSGLTSVTIPNSVTHIGQSAFGLCTGLTQVNYLGTPEEWYAMSIGNAGSPVIHSRNLFFNGIPLNHLVLPDTTTTVNTNFRYDTMLYTVIIPEGVTAIEGYAFYNCSGLTSVTIPDSVTSIGVFAFYGCTGLTSVTIPNSVTSIGNAAFKDCSGLISVAFNADSCAFAGNQIYNYRVFAGCSNITSFTFGNNVKRIPAFLCIGMAGLTSISIPDSVTHIEVAAFDSCVGLTSVNIPTSVTYLSGFSNCTGLTSVTIPNSVTTIGNCAFMNSSGLTTVSIPNSVTEIWDDAFRGCSGLTSITIPGSITIICREAFYQCTGLTSLTIPNPVTSIGELAFGDCSELTSVTFLADSCLNLGYGYLTTHYAQNPIFYNCTNLTSINIGSNVKRIPEYAFSYLPAQCSVNIPNTNSIEYIGDKAFIDCNGLDSIMLFNSVSYIGESAFRGDSNLLSVILSNGPTHIKSNTFCDCSSLSLITLPNNCTYLCDSAFYGCSNLTEITIPASVDSIMDYSFRHSSLQEITFLNPTPPRYISSLAFWGGASSGMIVNIPCGSQSQYSTRLQHYSYLNFNYVEHMFEFSAVSEDESKGVVYLQQEPTCTNRVAVLSAIPANGYRFDHWSTGCTNNPYTMTVTSDTTITAFFVEYIPETYNVTVTVDNPATGSVTGGGVYEDGSSVTITAYPADGYRFDYWSTGSTDNPYTLTVTSDTTIIAYFVSNGGTESIDEVGENDIRISVFNGCIGVEGVEQKDIQVYDITGRIADNRALPSGVYIVKIGQYPARKVVVIN